ncbi:DUF5374 domain-containing protein [Otariodibacter sp.]|uniref:DUF5374 domain-containing protein n=1 Tax=Otariodibacter sp. TaxID=3030919 RepID=UPI0026170182|nr:DUF5374 domain-containing protein [Otariodibacter sp.]
MKSKIKTQSKLKIHSRITAQSSLSILIAINVFVILTLGYMHWESLYNQKTMLVFQKQQALQIAENQISRLMSGRECEQNINQNDVSFTIICSPQKIKVNFPLGEVIIQTN